MIKQGHRYFGYFMITLSQVAILTGTLKYAAYQGQQVNLLGVVHFILVSLIVLGAEVLYQRFSRGETPYADTHVTVTREEFAQRVDEGEELVILDDLILDVSEFKAAHPGGRFLIEHNVGRDISKYFYGGYTLEQEGAMKPKTHTNAARSIVNHLVVGRLIGKAHVFNARITASQVINHFSKTFIMRVDNGHSQGWRQHASTDLEGFGRHILVRSY
jgi:cytochrome b involved in lipid metabolism